MSRAAAAPLLRVYSSALVKFASFPTKSVKAAAAVILQTRNNIPWHCNSELSLLSSFAFRICSLAEEVLRCHLHSTSGQHWGTEHSQPGQSGNECSSLSSGNVLVLQQLTPAPAWNSPCRATGSERRNLRDLGHTGADSVLSVLSLSVSRLCCASRERELVELLVHQWSHVEFFQLLSHSSGNLG